MQGSKRVLSLEEKGSLRLEKENTVSWPVFLPEEVPHMAVPAKLDELQLRNTIESQADGAEFRNGRRLPHNSGKINTPDKIRVTKPAIRAVKPAPTRSKAPR
jgi:hypothetical protein